MPSNHPCEVSAECSGEMQGANEVCLGIANSAHGCFSASAAVKPHTPDRLGFLMTPSIAVCSRLSTAHRNFVEFLKLQN